MSEDKIINSKEAISNMVKHRDAGGAIKMGLKSLALVPYSYVCNQFYKVFGYKKQTSKLYVAEDRLKFEEDKRGRRLNYYEAAKVATHIAAKDFERVTKKAYQSFDAHKAIEAGIAASRDYTGSNSLVEINYTPPKGIFGKKPSN
jgi:hypothetical protein